MASLQTLERRILALEARLADVEGGYGDTLYKLHRASIKADLRTARILQHLNIEDVPDEQIDAVLDEDRARTRGTPTRRGAQFNGAPLPTVDAASAAKVSAKGAMS
jgi:hypothetical protein